MSHAAAVSITRHSGKPHPVGVEQCDCGAWCAPEEIWTCQHRKENRCLCLKRCCTCCQTSDAGYQLEACDGHVADAARRQNQIIERYTKTLLSLSVTGDAHVKHTCKTALDLSDVTGEPEQPAQLIIDLAREFPCMECGHMAIQHKCFDSCECQHEPGDRDGVAMPPCQCTGDPIVKRIVLWLRGDAK